ncbi:hypothetical protein F5Y05DRAFT_423315 [Hypoxylon sp. FL0543]|nr:hypothetical protein F5Y05DRAFT_423315 [Hypoxylon sp. FL0543]
MDPVELAEAAAYDAATEYDLYQSTGDPIHLNQAVRTGTLAVFTIPEGHHLLPEFLSNLSVFRQGQYQYSGEALFAEEAVRVAQQAVDLVRDDDPAKAGLLDTLSNSLELHFTNDATLRGAFLNGLSNKITLLYKYTDKLEDLDDAIKAAREIVAITPQDDPNRPSYLTNLASKLHIRHERIEREEDLEEAITAARDAVDMTPPENKLRLAGRLNNLGLMLTGRYKQSHDADALLEAVESLQRAVELTPEGHAERAGGLDSLGIALRYLLFEFTGEVHYIDEAIRIARDAVSLTPDNDPNLSGRLNNLASKHGRRYLRLLDMEDLESSRDLDKAIQLSEQVVKGTAGTDPVIANCRSNLGVLLDSRYDLDHNSRDIERAVDLAREAVDSTPMDHPDRSAFLIRLANSLVKCAGQTRDEKSLDEALKCYLEAAGQPLGLALTRVMALRTALLVLTIRGNWTQAAVVAETAVKLIPQICSRYATREDQQYAVMQTSGLAADACAVLLKVPGKVEKAVELLELGRGLIIGYIIDDLDDLSHLQSIDDSSARRYRTLKTQASMPIDGWGPVGRERLLKERREAVYAIDACIRDIRQTVPGQERFLLGPTIEEIKSHAVEGPIIIVNVTDIASDAIIVSHKLIKSVPLPGLSPATAPAPIQYQFRQYVSNRRGDYNDRDLDSDDSDDDDAQPDQLTWLWVHCVKAVLDELRIMGLVCDPDGEDGPRRLWWMGSGIATSFPFHAAGNSTESALDSVVSSYTPTIKTLGYARERSIGANTMVADKSSGTSNEPSSDDTILVVTMPTTPGSKPLRGAQRECAAIEKVVTALDSTAAHSDSSSLRKTFRVQRLPQPCVRDVLSQIVQSSIIHFACHGFSDAKDPSRSHLLLQRRGGGDASGPVVDRLTITELAKAVAAQPAAGSAGGARIAFLSACSTAEVRARGLGDEGLHLASAFQMAGFVDVVGSLWSVDDDVCVALAEAFYSRLLGAMGSSRVEGTKVRADLGSGGRVAEALRYAVMRLRTRYPESPFLWTPFVHFGA